MVNQAQNLSTFKKSLILRRKKALTAVSIAYVVTSVQNLLVRPQCYKVILLHLSFPSDSLKFDTFAPLGFPQICQWSHSPSLFLHHHFHRHHHLNGREWVLEVKGVCICVDPSKLHHLQDQGHVVL